MAFNKLNGCLRACATQPYSPYEPSFGACREIEPQSMLQQELPNQ